MTVVRGRGVHLKVGGGGGGEVTWYGSRKCEGRGRGFWRKQHLRKKVWGEDYALPAPPSLAAAHCDSLSSEYLKLESCPQT